MRLIDHTINYCQRRNPALAAALQVLRQLPLKHRKVIVSAVQLGDTYPYHDDIISLVPSTYMDPYSLSSNRPRIFSPYSLDEVFIPIMHSHLERSFVWMFARVLPEESSRKDMQDITNATFLSEFTAATTEFSDHQKLSYPYPGLYNPTYPPKWLKGSELLMNTFVTHLQKCPMLFPNVQRKKNVSGESRDILMSFDSQQGGYVRTVDLEVFYHKTGIKIGGYSELRRSWKYNDLKPRLYYCQGGEQYFKSRYIKRIAVLLMESIPQTGRRRRTNPEQYLVTPLSDFLVYWDFKAFTSTLSELKYFLNWIVDGVERTGIILSCFDYHYGVVQVPAFELLNDYNEAVNVLAGFYIHRVLPYITIPIPVDRPLKMANSGQLGVGGNIGFSTSLHGYAIGQINRHTKKSVCVGDDALSSQRGHPDKDMIPHMKKIGNIETSKFGIVEQDSVEPFRFLKRRFERSSDGHYLDRDSLWNIPVAAVVDGYTDPQRTRSYDRKADYKRVVTSVGALLWDVKANPSLLSNHDLKLLQAFLSNAYRSLQLPFQGAIASIGILKGRDEVKNLMVPSVLFSEYDPRSVDWAEHLMEKYVDIPITIPMYDYPYGLTWLDPLITNIRTQHKYWSALEDMGYVELGTVFETIDLRTEANKRKVRVLLNMENLRAGFQKVVEIRVLRNIPDHLDITSPLSSTSANAWKDM